MVPPRQDHRSAGPARRNRIQYNFQRHITNERIAESGPSANTLVALRRSVDGITRSIKLPTTAMAYGTKIHSILPAAACRSARNSPRCLEQHTASSRASSAIVLITCAPIDQIRDFGLRRIARSDHKPERTVRSARREEACGTDAPNAATPPTARGIAKIENRRWKRGRPSWPPRRKQPESWALQRHIEKIENQR